MKAPSNAPDTVQIVANMVAMLWATTTQMRQ